MTQPSTSTLPDHYATLQVSETASPEVITAAYRSLARKYHPDANPSLGADAKMKAINAAYDVLSDRNKRAAYDRQRAAAAKPVYAPAPPPSAQPAPPRPTPPPPQSAPPAAAPAPFSIGSVLTSPAFITFVIAFIIVFAVLTILAEALMQGDYEWLIIPVSVVIAGGVAFVKSRQKA